MWQRELKALEDTHQKTLAELNIKTQEFYDKTAQLAKVRTRSPSAAPAPYFCPPCSSRGSAHYYAVARQRTQGLCSAHCGANADAATLAEARREPTES